MNLGNTVSGIDIRPSFKLWWNKYHIKAEVKGNWLIHDPMVLEEIYKFQNQYCWDTMKFAWHKNYSVYFSDSKVAKKFIRKFKDSIISVQGIRSQEEYDVITSNNQILRRQLFFNKYRYVAYKYWPNIDWVKKVSKLSMDAKVTHTGDGWKSTVYMTNKKDVAKLQLTVGNSEIYKVVTTEEL
jgi:hypothetical protein